MQQLSTKGTMMILIRHGERVSRSGETQEDANDAPLTAYGRQQAVQAAQILQSMPLAALYSSPYQRCVQTALIICERQRSPLPLVYEPELREWDILPSYRGHPARAAWKYLCRATDWLRPPEGEAIEDLAWRGARVFERIARHHQGHTIALCGHKALFRATCQQLVWTPALIQEELELNEGSMLCLCREQCGQWIALPLQPIRSNKRTEEIRQP